MAVVVPLAAAAFTASAGLAAVATGTILGAISGYAMVAGAVLTGVGALTGKKDLLKAGSILSLAGGVGSLANSAMTSASSAASEIGKDVIENGALAAAESAAPAAQSLTDAASSSLMGQGGVFGDATTLGGGFGSPTGAMGGSVLTGAPAAPSLIQKAAGSMTMDDITGFLKQAGDKTGDFLGKTGEFVKRNKELVQIAGSALDSAYGADAEMVDLKRNQLRDEQALIKRAQKNMNSPVKLYNYGGGT